MSEEMKKAEELQNEAAEAAEPAVSPEKDALEAADQVFSPENEAAEAAEPAFIPENEKHETVRIQTFLEDPMEEIDGDDDEDEEEKPKGHKRRIVISTIAVAALIAAALSVTTNIPLRAVREAENTFFHRVTMSTGTYTGETTFGEFSGEGVFSFDTGVTYDGGWEANQFQGKGTISYPGTGTYTGGFYRGKREGSGTFTWESGDAYDGEWEADQMNGTGTYTFAGGSALEGTFEENTFVLGVYTYRGEEGDYEIRIGESGTTAAEVTFADGTTLTGNFDSWQISGSGTMSFANGDVYSGAFSEGSRSGRGTYTWSDGSVYSGEWSDDAMNGEGIYTFADGSELSGTFSENTFTDGTYTIPGDGRYMLSVEEGEFVEASIFRESGVAYDGGYSGGILSGEGNVTYSNGETYSGDFSGGVRAGQGVYQWSDGSVYDGAWSNDNMNGWGTYYFTDNGYKLTGNFQNGQPYGTCTFYASETESYETEWDGEGNWTDVGTDVEVEVETKKPGRSDTNIPGQEESVPAGSKRTMHIPGWTGDITAVQTPAWTSQAGLSLPSADGINADKEIALQSPESTPGTTVTESAVLQTVPDSPEVGADRPLIYRWIAGDEKKNETESVSGG
ncbi:MAG: hypothetical protein Q4B15_08650 [Lachnospiraceae bacterium]|nr:hypothetical protein [Lachnospiraceae bacterium]